MSAKTFLLGVGCQKGGTTWLHNYLDEHPQVDMGFAKEYHVFDVVNLPVCGAILDEYLAAADKVTSLMRDRDFVSARAYRPRILQRFDFARNHNLYFEYFEHLAYRHPEIRLVGDITPSYAGLSASVFDYIKQEVARRELRTKVVFLLRDPVERVWSAVRMSRKNRVQSRVKPGEEVQFDRTEAEEVLALYDVPGFEMRTRYETTIDELEKVFAPEDIYVGFYEELFERETLADITAFLGVDHIAADTERRINASSKADSLPEDVAHTVRTHYASTYEAMRNRFGEDRVNRLWTA